MPRARSEQGGIDLRKIPRIIFRPLGREGADGQAHHPAYQDVSQVEPTLEVDHTRMKGVLRLETIIHEAFHLAVPAAPEYVVRDASRYIARIVWHTGYRADEEWQNGKFSNKNRQGEAEG